MEADTDWRALTPAEREREYSPSSCVGGDISAFLDAYSQRSQLARSQVEQAGRPVTEVRYGPVASQTIDLVTPEPAGDLTPLLAFIHGGYWQQLSKVESFFSAHDCLTHGVAFAAIDYTLAPHASLDEIVAECRSALATLVELADDYHVDTARIVVAGSSAGAHLAAMVGLGITLPSGSTWRPAALGLVSGIFELEPLIGTSINDALQLDEQEAVRNSPMFGELAAFPRSLVTFGSNETTQFKHQSTELARRIASAGGEATLVEITSRNHFDIILDLCDSSTELGRLMLGHLERRVS